jgi:hypothetical protein
MTFFLISSRMHESKKEALLTLKPHADLYQRMRTSGFSMALAVELVVRFNGGNSVGVQILFSMAWKESQSMAGRTLVAAYVL